MLRSRNFLQIHAPVTFEKILSGQGIANLYQFLYPTRDKLSPEQVGMYLQQHPEDELFALFAWYLGLLIGTVQLAFMPEGGIWISGGVAMHHLAIFDHPEFYAGIEASPAYLAQRKNYPLGVLCNPDHALMGGAYYAAKKLLV